MVDWPVYFTLACSLHGFTSQVSSPFFSVQPKVNFCPSAEDEASVDKIARPSAEDEASAEGQTFCRRVNLRPKIKPSAGCKLKIKPSTDV